METTSAAATTATTAAHAQSAAQKGTITSDFETFLKMLTAQMENQDPLNPIESSDYAVQIATFSGVEQQVLTNDLLEELTTALGAAGIGQYADWVGKEVRVAAAAPFEGSPLTVMPDVAAGADTATLVVRDAASGETVQRVQIGTDGAAFDWAGVAADGTPLPAGLYEFHVESYQDGARIAEAQAEVYAPVAEVRATETGVTVVLAGGEEVAAGSVTALRLPGG